MPWAVVLEDDAQLAPGFTSRVLEGIDRVPSDWHILLLGCFHCSNTRRHVNDVIRVPDNFAGFHGYAISNSGARFVLSRIKKVSYHIDMHVNSIAGVRLYSLTKDVVFQGGATRTSANVSAGFPHSLTLLLSQFSDSKGNSADFFAMGPLLRLGPYTGPHIVVTYVTLFFLTIGIFRAPWRWVALVSAVDMALWWPTSALQVGGMAAAYGLGLMIGKIMYAL
jgi:hypothetical protein